VLLRAVVQVALDPAARLVGRPDDAGGHVDVGVGPDDLNTTAGAVLFQEPLQRRTAELPLGHEAARAVAQRERSELRGVARRGHHHRGRALGPREPRGDGEPARVGQL
jgi:hypothetical protein